MRGVYWVHILFMQPLITMGKILLISLAYLAFRITDYEEGVKRPRIAIVKQILKLL